MQLVILAAGQSRRFGRPKQLENVYKNKTIIDYNILNATENNIKDIIIVTNKVLEERMSKRYSKKAKIYSSDFERKTIGNLYTLYSILDKINGDFIVVNADDYYEKSVFKKAKKFLNKGNENIAIVTYKLNNVLSSNGPVNRGLVIKNRKYLLNIKETVGIEKNNHIIKDQNENVLNGNNLVSMGFYIFKKSIKDDIKEYVEMSIKNKLYLKHELRLTEFISNVKSKYKIKILKTNAKWTGITFKEDKKDAYNFFKNKC